MIKIDVGEAVQQAKASVELEGYSFTREENILIKKLSNKEITHNDYLKILNEKVKKHSAK